MAARRAIDGRRQVHVPRPAKDAGFGLVELVVSMGVLAVVSLVLVLGMGESFRTVSLAQQRSAATGLLSAADAEIQATPPSELATLAPPAATTVNGIDYCTSFSSSTGGTGAPLLYTFVITVTWPTCQGSSSLTGAVQAGGT